MNGEEIMNTMDIVAFIASLTSIILAILAIILSIVFYKWSDNSNKDIQKVAQAIDGNTKKIENLFDKLYTDTFGLMKSNVEAMQNRFYNVPSSGDSSLDRKEYLEEIIFSILQKNKKESRDKLVNIILSTQKEKEYKESEILAALESLEQRDKLSKTQNDYILKSYTSNEGGSEE
ncbi:hypothetical protein AAG747_29180 [Rapidithrix thailandica]|uniref:Uncharacterized protein n=1 Tax=Rapidithrix thailandica TaxID=413964 RepID=A0AAW9SIA4_9BACT